VRGGTLTTRSCSAGSNIINRPARGVHERMVSQPRPFLAAVRANQARRAGERPHGGPGPEGECISDLGCLEAVITRLRNRVAALCALPPPIAAVPRLRAAIGRPVDRA
jgi:hypothetical protein